MVKLLNVKAMEKVIESKNYNKIVGGVIGERYSVEAIDYLLKEATKNEEFIATYTFDHIIYQLSYNKGSYKFSNFFKDYEEYVYSAFVKAIFEKRNTGDYITWFDFFPSEEEIKRLYNSATPEMKSVIYKTLVYRRTSYALGTEFFDLYADSYKTLIQMIMEQENMNEKRACEYFMKWSYAINKNAIEGIQGMIGKEDTIDFLTKRLNGRFCGGDSVATSIKDFQEIIDYLYEAGEISRINIAKKIIRNFEIYNWKIGEFNETGVSILKTLYNKYISPIVFDGDSAIMNFSEEDSLYIFRNNFGFFYGVEDREDRKVAIVEIYRKLHDGQNIANQISHMINMARNRKTALNITIPEQISKDSLRFAYRIDEFIPCHKIEVEELKEILRVYFPHRTVLNEFGENDLLKEYIDMEKILLENENDIKVNFSSSFNTFFKDDVIPVSVIKKYSDKLGKYTCLRSLTRGTNVTPEEILELTVDYKMFEDFSSEDRVSLYVTALKNMKVADERIIAELIKALKLSGQEYYSIPNNPVLDKVNLRNVLTLL